MSTNLQKRKSERQRDKEWKVESIVEKKKTDRLLTRRPSFDRSALQSKSWLNSIKATSNATWSTSVPPFGTLRAKLTIWIAVEPPGICWAVVRVLSAAERTVRHVASLYMFGKKSLVWTRKKFICKLCCWIDRSDEIICVFRERFALKSV